ncbi:MAG: hypothetical protein FWH40_00375 [Coriobacteriia bacterium]|nr:hypothetical protein [Coriobacteriia bacterium]
MDYTLMLCFEEAVESEFKSIVESIAQSGLSSYLVDVGVPPHLSLACFSTEDIEPIIDEMDKQTTMLKTGSIAWPALGFFTPHTLFAAAVLNEYLLNACIWANSIVEPFSTAGENGFYLPYNWIPHTSLAMQLDDDRLQKATAIAMRQFSFIRGKSNRLKLVAYKYTPYQEIKTWNLENG